MLADKFRFNAAFKTLAAALRLPTAEVTSDMKRAYYDGLSDLPIEAIEKSAIQLAKSAKWFPKVSEWRETVRSYHKLVDNQALVPAEQRDQQWRHECEYCEDGGWCYEGGKTLHEVVMSGYEGRPRMHACVCRATNHTYQRRNRGFGGAA
jgi:hypothetical protein